MATSVPHLHYEVRPRPTIHCRKSKKRIRQEAIVPKENSFQSHTKVVLLAISRALASRLWATKAFRLTSQSPFSTTSALPFTTARVTDGGSEPCSHSVVGIRFTSGYFTWTQRQTDRQQFTLYRLSFTLHIVSREIQILTCCLD